MKRKTKLEALSISFRPAQKTIRAIDSTDFGDFLANFFRRRAMRLLSTGMTAAVASLVVGKKVVPLSFRSVAMGGIALAFAGVFTLKILRRKQDLNRATTLHLHNLKDFKQRREVQLHTQLWQEMRAHMIPAHRNVELPDDVDPLHWDDLSEEVKAFINRETAPTDEDDIWPVRTHKEMLASLTHFVRTHQELRRSGKLDAHEQEHQLGYQTTVFDEWMDQIMRAGGVSKYAKYDPKIQRILGITRGRFGSGLHKLLHPEESTLLDRFTKNRILFDMVGIVDAATARFIPHYDEAPPGARYRRFSLLDCLDCENDQRSNLIRCFDDADIGHDIADFFSDETKKALARVFSLNPETMAEHVFFMFLADIKLGLQCRISVDPLFTVSKDLRRYVEQIERRYHVKILDNAALDEAEADTAAEIKQAETFVDLHFPRATSSQRRAFVIAYHLDFKIRNDRHGLKTQIIKHAATGGGGTGQLRTPELTEKVEYIFASEVLFFRILNSSRQFFALSCRIHVDTYFEFFRGVMTHETKPIRDFQLIETPGPADRTTVVLRFAPADGLLLDRAQTAEKIAKILKCAPPAHHHFKETPTTVSFEFAHQKTAKHARPSWVQNRLQDHLLGLLVWRVDRANYDVVSPALPLSVAEAEPN